MSPEVMCAQNHTIAVDYFAVGVIAYEFMHGRVKILLVYLFKLKLINSGRMLENLEKKSKSK
jgi:hypothetical protein